MSRTRTLLLLAAGLFVVGCVEEPTAPGLPIVDGPSLHTGVDEGGSHFRYGTLSWVSTGNPGEVEFNLRAAFRRSAYTGSRCIGSCPGGLPVTGDIIVESQGPTGFAFGDGSIASGGTGTTLRFLVTGFDTSEPNSNEHWVIGQALDPVAGTPGILHTYSSAGPFLAHTAVAGTESFSCCRIGQFGLVTLNNRSGSAYPIQTDVSPLSGNRSPVSGMLPIVVVPEDPAATFLVPAGDPDGDPIRWRLSTDAEAGGPSHPPGISVDGSSGVVTWNNVGLSQTGSWTTQVVVEDLDASGNPMTKTPVDFLLKIRPLIGSLPRCSISPAGPHTAIVGSSFSFGVTGSDPDAGATVTLNSGGIPPGASMSPSLPVSGASPQSSTFSWTPTAAQEGTHVVLFSATDEHFQQGLCSTTIEVIRVIPVVIDIKPGSDPNSVQCRDTRGVIPVAILSTRTAAGEPVDFDATTVDHTAVRFGKNGDDAAETHHDPRTGMVRHEEDVDEDGDTDLVFHFEYAETGFSCDDVPAGERDATVTGKLTGMTMDGVPIEGEDDIRLLAGGKS